MIASPLLVNFNREGKTFIKPDEFTKTGQANPIDSRARAII